MYRSDYPTSALGRRIIMSVLAVDPTGKGEMMMVWVQCELPDDE